MCSCTRCSAGQIADGTSRSREEQELAEHFPDEYRRVQTPVMLDPERVVCGCDHGGTSRTTRDDADHSARLLELGAGTKLLEIGAGPGWPVLHLAEKPVATRPSRTFLPTGRLNFRRCSLTALPPEPVTRP